MYDFYVSSHTPTFRTPDKYIKAKLKILKRDFCIDATEEEVNDINNRIMEAEKEYEALTGKPYVEENCEREEEVA